MITNVDKIGEKSKRLKHLLVKNNDIYYILSYRASNRFVFLLNFVAQQQQSSNFLFVTEKLKMVLFKVESGRKVRYFKAFYKKKSE